MDSTRPTPGTSLADGQVIRRLVVLGSPHAKSIGTNIALTEVGVTIGRGPAARSSLVLQDSEASREHAVIEYDGKGFVVRDLGSRNGSFLNGTRITQAPFGPNDVLRIGAHLLLFDWTTIGTVRNLIGTASVASQLVGRSLTLRAVQLMIERAAKLDAPVLILGPSGTGKELVASELHRLSGRTGRFVPVNCAALPEQLAESELFGHAKGAFTGAANANVGLFAEADGGTIFLDEIGETAAPLQAKLLRVLATGEVRPVGETRARNVATRVVAATNVDLDRAIEAGTFRGDLYSRLMGIVIELPGLDERKEDVLPLADRFIDGVRAGLTLSADAQEALLIYKWRFNVRELKHTVEVAAANAGTLLDLHDLPERFHRPFQTRLAGGAQSGELPILLSVPPDRVPDANGLRRVAEEMQGNVSRIAEYFGKSRRQIHRWAEQHGLELGASRED